VCAADCSEPHSGSIMSQFGAACLRWVPAVPVDLPPPPPSLLDYIFYCRNPKHSFLSVSVQPWCRCCTPPPRSSLSPGAFWQRAEHVHHDKLGRTRGEREYGPQGTPLKSEPPPSRRADVPTGGRVYGRYTAPDCCLIATSPKCAINSPTAVHKRVKGPTNRSDEEGRLSELYG
jgi:hypothetical protein